MTSIAKARKRKVLPDWRRVLVLSEERKHQRTVKRHYLLWRTEQGLPLRCDAAACEYHTGPLEWNGNPLRLVLDHLHGNHFDNLPASLRLLCPNCDSQLTTKGGGNRGRVVRVVEGGFALRNKDGSLVEAATGQAVGKSEASASGMIKR